MGELSMFLRSCFLFANLEKRIRSHGTDLVLIVGIGGLGIVISNYNQVVVTFGLKIVPTLRNLNPEYLKNKATDSKQVVDYKDWQITHSRRFLSMKLWIVMKSYGVSGLREFIRRHVKMAKHFEPLLCSDKIFEVVVLGRNFATVCFRIAPLSENSKEEDLNQLTKRLLESLNRTGKVYMTHAVVEDICVIRVAIGATLTEEKHVDKLWDMVQEHAVL